MHESKRKENGSLRISNELKQLCDGGQVAG
ncbi:MAG: hypothetical protein K0S32_3302 [Bacteroidetes bacterium]|nr:hypothetical protein [Bacteroidota bacterium]